MPPYRVRDPNEIRYIIDWDKVTSFEQLKLIMQLHIEGMYSFKEKALIDFPESKAFFKEKPKSMTVTDNDPGTF
jgi:hypothetical protein